MQEPSVSSNTPANQPFRDDTVGAELQRNRLLRKRRDDFAEMPETIREIVAARFARSGAGLCGGLVAGILLFLSWWLGEDAVAPSWMHPLFPGPGVPALLVTLTGVAWLAIALGHCMGHALGERSFSRRTRHVLRTGADVFQDLDRLAKESPREAGLWLARAVEILSIAAPLIAIGLLALPTVHLISDLQHGRPNFDRVEFAIVESLGWHVLIGSFSILTAAAFRDCLRHIHFREALNIFLWSGAVVALAFLPWFNTRASAAMVLVLGAIVLLFRKAQKERTVLGLRHDDPPLGAITLQRVRAALLHLRHTATRWRLVIYAIAGAVAVAGSLLAVALHDNSRPSTAAEFTAALAVVPPAIAATEPVIDVINHVPLENLPNYGWSVRTVLALRSSGAERFLTQTWPPSAVFLRIRFLKEDGTPLLLPESALKIAGWHVAFRSGGVYWLHGTTVTSLPKKFILQDGASYAELQLKVDDDRYPRCGNDSRFQPMSPQQVKSILSGPRVMAAVNHCGDAYEFMGSVRVKVNVSVGDVSIVDIDSGNAELDTCISGVLMNVHFPGTGSGEHDYLLGHDS
jgi:hypothetical protein